MDEDLLFKALTGPRSGEGTEWWKLNSDPREEVQEDLKDGILSNGTFYVHPFKVTTTTFCIGDYVDRIVFPSVNVKFDRIEIFNGFDIPIDPDDPNGYTNEELKELVEDVADTGEDFFTSIEGLEVDDDDLDNRQEETEGPFDFSVTVDGTNTPVFDDAFVDGYYVGIDTPKVPTFTNGEIEIRHKGTFDLNELERAGNALDPVYQSLIDFIDLLPDGLFTVDNTYTFQFSINELSGTGDLTGTNGRDVIIASGDASAQLTGSFNNDNISGGNGPEVIDGAGAGSLGTHEIDILSGGGGPDTYVLEDRYLGGGSGDYAVIEDLETIDTILLGTSEYDLDDDVTFKGQSGTLLSVNDDLVAFFKGVGEDMVEALLM